MNRNNYSIGQRRLILKKSKTKEVNMKYVTYRGKTYSTTQVENMMIHRQKMDNPDLIEEKYRQSAVVGMFRCGAKMEQIAVHQKVSVQYAKAIVKAHLQSFPK